MSYATPTETHKAAKQHVCDWCGESIVAGETYKRWRYYGDLVVNVRSHPECLDAAEECASEWGQDETYFNRSQPRGCWCGHSTGCETCAARNSTPQA